MKRNLTPGSTPPRSSTAFQHRSHAPTTPSDHAYHVISCVIVRKPPETVRHGPNSTHLLVRRTRPTLAIGPGDGKMIFFNPEGLPCPSHAQTNTHRSNIKKLNLFRNLPLVWRKKNDFFRICQKETASDSKLKRSERKFLAFSSRGDLPGNSAH